MAEVLFSAWLAPWAVVVLSLSAPAWRSLGLFYCCVVFYVHTQFDHSVLGHLGYFQIWVLCSAAMQVPTYFLW